MMRKQAIGGVLLAPLLTVGLSAVTFAPRAEAATYYSMGYKQIVWGGNMVSRPAGFAAIDPASGKYTTYMPIWYVMQALKSAGITSGWDGTNWTMSLPSNIAPTTDLQSASAGRGSGNKRISINNVDIQNVNGIVATDPSSNQATTFIPVWYVMKVLGYENVHSGWDGTHWTMTPPPAPVSNPAPPAQASLSASGVTAGVANQGNIQESWLNNQHDVTLDNLPYTGGSDTLPLRGIAHGAQGDIVVEVYNSPSENWFYSVPVDSNGAFAVTVTLPYQGNDCVSVGIPQETSTFGLGTGAAYLYAQNNQPTLPDSQMALLQSWMVNYNESGNFKTLSSSIVASAGTRDGQIKAVSDWVSANTEYNFPEVNNNQIVWQQATNTVNTRVGVCQDQAALAAALLRSAGIPTKVIGGDAYYTDGTYAGPHAWDMAWDGSRWVTFDSTWDQNYPAGANSVQLPTSITDAWFDPPQSSFDQTHKPDPTQPFEWIYR